MTEIRIDFQDTSGSSPAPGFNGIAGDAAYLDLFDTESNHLGIDCTLSGFGSGTSISFGGSNASTGDASWVPTEVSGTGRQTPASGLWATVTFSGNLNESSTYKWELYGVASSGDNELICRVNGGPSQQLPTFENQSNTLVFGDLSVVGGEIVVEISSSASETYLGAGRLIEETGPSITLDNATRTPGSTISGSYANFEGVPTSPLALTDSNDNSMDITVTIDDNGDGSGTFTGTMPALPTEGNSAAGLLFGTITAELTDPGA